MMGNNHGDSAIYSTARTSATPHFKAVGGAIGREHKCGAESLPQTGAKSGGDSQKATYQITDSRFIGRFLRVSIPESLEGNSYLGQLVIFLDTGFYDLAIECIENAIKAGDEVHTFEVLLGRVHDINNAQLDLFNHKNGVAGRASPTPRL